MVGNTQSALDLQWVGIQGAAWQVREEVGLTSALLLDDLLLQVLHDIAMFPLE